MHYRLLYYSRSRITGTLDEVDTAIAELLVSARIQNALEQVTGVLLFNGYSFAQVLEGSQEAVEWIFGKIRQDSRHTDVVLLEAALEHRRHFGEWSMAYVNDWTIHYFQEPGSLPAGRATRPESLAVQLVEQLQSIVNAPSYRSVI